MLSLHRSMNYGPLKFRICLWGTLLLSLGISLRGAGPASAPDPVPDPEMDKMLQRVEARYNHLKTLRLHFEQVYKQNERVVREESGILFLRKPGQMRWEYQVPEEKLFLSKGRQLTLYLPQENRVTQTEVKNSDDLRSPIRFLLGGLRFQKEFENIERIGDSAPEGGIVIKALPKRMKEILEWVVLEIGPEYQIRKIILKELTGTQTEFHFKDEVVNLQLSQELFKFQPPEGAEIVRQ